MNFRMNILGIPVCSSLEAIGLGRGTSFTVGPIEAVSADRKVVPFENAALFCFDGLLLSISTVVSMSVVAFSFDAFGAFGSRGV